MKQVFSKLTSVSGSSRWVGVVGVLLAVGIAFGWAPFRDDVHVRVLATPGPEAEILAFIRDRHPELGLDVTVSREAVSRDARGGEARGGEDYVSGLTSGDFDVASADTHVGFRERVQNTGAALVSAGETVTKPLGFYPASGAANAHFTAGTTVVLPAEQQAQARALLLLYSSGYVTFARDANTDLTLAEVTGNPKALAFTASPRAERLATLQAPGPVLVALTYDEATTLGLQPARDAKLMEDGFSPFAGVLVVRERDANAPWLKSLLGAYRDTDVKAYILQTYNDSVRRPW